MSKHVPDSDPFAEREAERYDNPIPSREHIMTLLDEEGAPLTLDAIAQHLELSDPRDLEALRRRLRAMERDGQLIRNRRGGYGLVSRMDLVRGRVLGHPDGFGFLVPDEGGGDLFVSPKEMRRVMHGDRVVARVTGIDRRGRREAAIVEVLERAHEQVVGRLFVESGVGFVTPDNKRLPQDILVPEDQRYGAVHGQIVMVQILQQPTSYRQAIGRVVEILGDHMAPGMEIDVAIRAHGLRQTWSPLVEAEIEHFSEVVPEDAKTGREDLRDLPLVTIDGEDARDFDDAVFCEPDGQGWRLIVAIADVAAYVKPGTALDAEARERGNSVYFPEYVIPMLPEILSNGLCSLNPEVDRLSLACEMRIDAEGELRDYRFLDGVIRSHARLTYNKVAAMVVERDPALREEYAAVLPHVEHLYALYRLLRGRREARGAIDFETTETRIVFGPERKIERIVPVERNEAHRLIEECMLMANVSAADFLLEREIPALYRVHGGPNPEKLTALREFLSALGLQLHGGDDPEPRHYAELLAQVAEREDRHLIQTVMLRSLSQAVYSPENVGHFGLSYEAYAHFTSPIRRYPDLVVHRAIRHALHKGKPRDFMYGQDDLVALGEHCSSSERRADEATRDAVDWLKTEYMLDKVGEEFEGYVTGVTGFGLFIELDRIYIEGLVHVTALQNDYYHFDPVHHRLTGERTGTVYRLADKVRVRVMRVDLDERKIDFELVLPEQPAAPGKPPSKSPQHRPGKRSKRGGRRRRGKKRTAGPDGD